MADTDRARRPLLVAAAALLAAMAVACGSPGPKQREFVFTPVPYTVIAGPRGTPVAIYETEPGSSFSADSIIVLVSSATRPEFEDWTRRVGFKILQSLDGVEQGTEILLIEVPVGSVPTAVDLARKQPGVMEVTPNGTFHLNEEP